jgi:thiol-disulfide isomerase/thioredoxin
VTSLVVAVALVAGNAGQHQAPPIAPADCVAAARDFTLARQRQADQITAEVVRRIQEEKVAMARRCAAQFDLEAVQPAGLADLIALYAEAELPDLAASALERALAAESLSPPERADVLVQAVVSGLREPKSPARNTRLEGYVDALDQLPDSVLDQKILVHSRLNGYYRGDDIDAGMTKHSTWLIEVGERLRPERHGPAVVTAYVNLAEVLAGHGRTDEALELLRTAKREWADVPSIDRRIDPVRARYELVGTVGLPIVAPRWLNMPAGTTALPMTGSVTLLEFTAHWCGPCKESYPGLKRLLARFGERGFRVVLATEMYGYFQQERPLTEDQEYDRDRAYFEDEGLSVPIAISGQRPLPERDAAGNYLITRNPNDQHYEVGGIPQIHIIDTEGRIRLIMVGYDDANEARLAELIESLLPGSGGSQ